MNFKRNFISIFLIAILALVLVGCGGETTETPTTETPTTEEITTQEVTTTEDVTTTTEAPVDLEALIAQLRTEYADTIDSDTFVATEDLTLLGSIGSIEITWSSNNETYLENDGTVHHILRAIKQLS